MGDSMGKTNLQHEEARRRVRESIERRRAAGARPAEIAAELNVAVVTIWRWRNGIIPEQSLSLVQLACEADKAEREAA